jgi:hypothetical protein
VGETGVAANHHFLAPKDGSSFVFAAGHYKLEVFARLLGDKAQKLLYTQTLEISRDVGTHLAEPGTGVYFDWGPDSGRYLSHVENRPPSQDSGKFLESLGLAKEEGPREIDT